jgi:error-prone DNA polymerase
MSPLPDYAELMCCSNYRFLVGASHPEELVQRAQALGYRALAITDECSVAGVVRAHVAAKACGLPLRLGSQFRVDGLSAQGHAVPWTLVLLVTSLRGWGHLCRFITTLRRRSPKGQYRLDLATLRHTLASGGLDDCLLIAVPEQGCPAEACDALARWMLDHAMGRSWLGLTQLSRWDDAVHAQRLRHSSALTAIPLVAVGDVWMHRRSRQPVQDVLTAVRLGKPLSDCGHALQPNAERHLRTRLRWRRPWWWPSAAPVFRSTSCATNTPTKACRQAAARPSICAI